MARDNDDISMALFCDFENIALGVRDAQYEKFDIKPVLERLLLKGSIVVKKAYCDWERYKSFKAAMHEANFELIEIPHVRQSGKNSADIRMVVDALDLCYTKAHVNTFVIISGDSDFSPLVSKLRENAKRVIGVGVKQSTSDLLIANCDEFIYVDDLVRKRQRESGEKQNRRPLDPAEAEARKQKGIGMALATVEALLEDRADDEKVWASVVKEALKRRHPGFNETYHGFKTFGGLLEEAHKRGLLEFGRDEKSGTYVRRRIGAAPPPGTGTTEAGDGDEAHAQAAVPPGLTFTDPPPAATVGEVAAAAPAGGDEPAEPAAPAATPRPSRTRRGGRSRRGGKNGDAPAAEATGASAARTEAETPAATASPEPSVTLTPASAPATAASPIDSPVAAKVAKPKAPRRPRAPRKAKAAE